MSISSRPYQYFNPRSREGSDFVKLDRSYQSYISILAPAKGATERISPLSRLFKIFQSSLPRRERQRYVLYKGPNKNISILAPAKGATTERCDPVHPGSISILAPAKGATLSGYLFVCDGAFQSSLPRRERPYTLICNEWFRDISILAPAKGATIHTGLGFDLWVFQSSLPRRERRGRVPKG